MAPPAETCLTAVEVPSPLPPTESESFPAPNRLLSGEERIRFVEEGQGREDMTSVVSTRYLGKLTQHPQESSFQLFQNLEQKRHSGFSIFILIPRIYRILCTFSFFQTVHRTCTLQTLIADFSLFSHRRFWLLGKQITLERMWSWQQVLKVGSSPSKAAFTPNATRLHTKSMERRKLAIRCASSCVASVFSFVVQHCQAKNGSTS